MVELPLAACREVWKNVLSVWRLQPSLEIREEAWLPMINGLLVTCSFIYRFLWMSSSNEVEQLRPNRLTSNELGGGEEPWGSVIFLVKHNTTYLDSLPPFSVFVMSDQQECPNPVCDARVSTKSSIHRPSL
jgi:hypothetical protein